MSLRFSPLGLVGAGSPITIPHRNRWNYRAIMGEFPPVFIKRRLREIVSFDVSCLQRKISSSGKLFSVDTEKVRARTIV